MKSTPKLNVILTVAAILVAMVIVGALAQ